MTEIVRRQAGAVAARIGGSSGPTAQADSRGLVALSYSPAPPKLADLDGLVALTGNPPALHRLGNLRGSVGSEPRVRRNKATGECREEGTCVVVGERGVARFLVTRPVQLRATAGRTAARATGPWQALPDTSWVARNPKQTSITIPPATSTSARPATIAAVDGLDPSEEFLAIPEAARSIIEGRVPYRAAETSITRAIHYSDGTEHITTLRIGAAEVVLGVAIRPHDGRTGTGPFVVDLFAADLSAPPNTSEALPGARREGRRAIGG